MYKYEYMYTYVLWVEIYICISINKSAPVLTFDIILLECPNHAPVDMCSLFQKWEPPRAGKGVGNLWYENGIQPFW